VRRTGGALAALAVRAESWWFDYRHGVHTSTATRDQVTYDETVGFWYLPTRPATAQAILRELPISDYCDYTFVDFGSGKGRMLMLAAEYSFRAVEGIEYDPYLHECAEQNLARRRGFRQGPSPIVLKNINACDYDFPAGCLVLYFFNPFGPDVMQTVLSRLDESLERSPRRVLVVSLYAEYDCAKASRFLSLYKSTGLCRIYQNASE